MAFNRQTWTINGLTHLSHLKKSSQVTFYWHKHIHVHAFRQNNLFCCLLTEKYDKNRKETWFGVPRIVKKLKMGDIQMCLDQI